MSDPSGPKPPPPPPPPPGQPPSGYQPAPLAYPSPPPYQPPPGTYQPPAPYQPPGTPGAQPYYPPGSPGYMAPPIVPTAALGVAGLSYQLGGRAAWSIGFGLLSVVVPLFVTGFYFRVTPVIGLFYGIQAIRQGRVIGGIAGIVLCVLGGLTSLFASGVLTR